MMQLKSLNFFIINYWAEKILSFFLILFFMYPAEIFFSFF
jgi:hypothetical protein